MRKVLSLFPVLALAACAVFNSPPTKASTITATWVNPTTNTDGSTIPTTAGAPEALQTWRVEYGTCVAGAFGVKAGEFIRTRAAGGPELTTATNNVPPGLTCVRVFVGNQAGRESDASNVASRVVEPSRPNPPNNVTASSG
jgi:hypothetical protein